jgi:transcriptional regulator with GAF, ATPase, and Fis domain
MPPVEAPPRKRMPVVDDEQRRRIEEALRKNGGNVAQSARDLGLHRTQLRRLLERHGIAVDEPAGAIDEPAGADDAPEADDEPAN